MRPQTKKLILLATIPALGLGWLAFRPELAFVNKTVDEKLPTAGQEKPVSIGQGSFVSYAHETTGTAQILSAGGAQILRLSNFKTSNGPDVRVLLTKSTDPKAFDEKSAIDLGVIKGNIGDQNYTLPSKIRAEDYQAVTIWCKRFNVSFGGALLKRETSMAAATTAPILTQAVGFQTIGGEIRVTSGALTGGGLAGLYEASGGRVLRISGFAPKGTRSADVYLVKAETLGKNFDFDSLTKVKLGTWSAGKGTQQFKVDKEIDAWLYRSVILWNPAAKKPVGTASLRSDQERAKKISLL